MNSSFKGIANSLACGWAAESHLSSKKCFQSDTNPVTTSSVFKEFGQTALACWGVQPILRRIL